MRKCTGSQFCECIDCFVASRDTPRPDAGAVKTEKQKAKGTTMGDKLFDVIAVNMETDKVRLMAKNKTRWNAEAIENMAIMRRGVDEEFFTVVEAGKFSEGDSYKFSA